MKISELIYRIREYLHDPDGKIWDDSELAEMIDRAAENYSSDTGIFRGHFNFVVDSDGGCNLPKNYIGFVAGWNDKGYHIENISVGELNRFYEQYTATDGDAEFVFEDLDDIGRFRFCPNPFKRQNITVYVPYYPYGIPAAPSYGIPTRTEDYGIPLKVCKFTKAGDVVFIRSERAENIPDYMALVYHVLYQAYNVDSDFSSPEKASLYNTQYRNRIARFGQMKSGNSSIRKRGKFY